MEERQETLEPGGQFWILPSLYLRTMTHKNNACNFIPTHQVLWKKFFKANPNLEYMEKIFLENFAPNLC